MFIDVKIKIPDNAITSCQALRIAHHDFDKGLFNTMREFQKITVTTHHKVDYEVYRNSKSLCLTFYRKGQKYIRTDGKV